jgi:O-antigen/teichoic acid export membrane protein
MSEAAPAPAAETKVILRNALTLIVSQAIVTPLSMIVNAVMARYLGAASFGDLYLAGTFASFGFLLVEWGQAALLTAKVARAHDRAGELLGSAIAFRMASSLLVGLVLVALSLLLGKGSAFALIVAVVAVSATMGTVVNACQDVVRGFERMDFGAASYVGWQVLRVVVVVPTLLLGGRLRAVLLAQAACAAIGMLAVLRALGPLGVKPLVARRATARELLIEGTPFVVFGLAMSLQPTVDAFFMSRLASGEAVGWYAAASKLMGALVYPAGVLIAALYPTACRLFAEDVDAYRRTAAAAMRTTAVLVIPLALSCGLYPDVGIRLFSRQSYLPAESDLRILSLYLLLVYFSMPIGTCLVAAGRQRAWAITQFGCVATSLALDPLLIPRFQRAYGNGGLGVCVASVASEVLMLSIGVALLPRGILGRPLLGKLARAGLAGLAMLAVARATHGLGSFGSAPLALASYAVVLWAAGGLDRNQLAALRALVRRQPPAA